jgi:hypothetical protein
VIALERGGDKARTAHDGDALALCVRAERHVRLLAQHGEPQRLPSAPASAGVSRRWLQRVVSGNTVRERRVRVHRNIAGVEARQRNVVELTVDILRHKRLSRYF